MKIRSLLQPLELIGLGEVRLHHIDESIIVFGAASRIFDEQSSGFLQDPAHLSARVEEIGSQLRIRFAVGGL